MIIERLQMYVILLNIQLCDKNKSNIKCQSVTFSHLLRQKGKIKLNFISKH
jgi:hypothetical protein